MKHHNPRYENVEPPSNHRFLNVGESSQEGDMIWEFGFGPWKKMDKDLLRFTKIIDHTIYPICRRISKEKLVLKLELVYPKGFEFDDNVVAFKIAEQSGFERCKSYKAKNGITIRSAARPCLSDDAFLIRGIYLTHNDAVLVTTKDRYNQIHAAINEILERENAPKIIKRVTFPYGAYGTMRVCVDVIEENADAIVGYDVDCKEKKIITFSRRNIEGEIETVVKA